MSDHLYRTPPNDRAGSQYGVPGIDTRPCVVFVAAEEPGKDGFVDRRCYTIILAPYLQVLRLGPIDAMREARPKKSCGPGSRGRA